MSFDCHTLCCGTSVPVLTCKHHKHHASIHPHICNKYILKSSSLSITHKTDYFHCPSHAPIPHLYPGPWILLILASHSATLLQCQPIKYNEVSGRNDGNLSCIIFISTCYCALITFSHYWDLIHPLQHESKNSLAWLTKWVKSLSLGRSHSSWGLRQVITVQDTDQKEC